MADKWHVRELWAGDIHWLAPRLRPADVLELRATFGPKVTAEDAIGQSIIVSSHVWVVAAGAEPLAILGVAPISLLEGLGRPWLVATDRIKPGTLVRVGHKYSRMMLQHYARLENFVDARNVRSVRWLKHIGFTVHEPTPYGCAGLPFHRFEIARAGA